MYEVFIGGWNNQRSVIRKNRAKPDVADVPTPNILNGGEFRTFWVRWDSNTVSCGCENNAQPFLTWQDHEHIQIRYVGVCTGWGASGSWIIHSGAPLPGYGAPAPGQFNTGFGGAPQPGFGGAPGYNPPPNQFGNQPGQFGGQPSQFGGQPGQFGGQPGPFGGQTGQFGGQQNWVSANSGNVPPGAYVGGEDKGEPVYVVRCNFQGSVIPGKLVPSHRTAYVPWGGVENGVAQYECLCNFNGRWVQNSGGNIPPNAVRGGQSENGEPLYIGRVRQEGTMTVGKVQASHNCLYIPYGGQEMSFPQYEILTS